jgi:hypothetical protein
MSRRRSRPKARLRFTVRHASDLLAVIPSLVGFHPTESIVAVLMRSGHVALTMRIDLPTTPSVADAGAALARQLTAVARDNRVSRIALVGYSAEPLPANRLLTATMDEMARKGSSVELADVYYADGERWWSLTCSGPCCPLEGTAYDLGSHPYVAEAVYAGMSIEPSRAALREGLLGPDPAEVAELEETLAAVLDCLIELDDLRLANSAIQQTVRDSLDRAEVSDEVCARLALLALNKTVRDHAWAMITHDDADLHAQLWRRVVSRVPPVVSAAPLGLLGMAAWIGGNGALQNVCGERLAEIHPGYTLGEILLDLSNRAVPPSAWDTWAAEMRQLLDTDNRRDALAG